MSDPDSRFKLGHHLDHFRIDSRLVPPHCAGKMPATSPVGPPPKFESGNSVTFIESFADYPASTWTLTLYLSLSGQLKFNKAFTADGDNFTLTITPTESETIGEGTYEFAEYASTDTERKTARTGQIVVLQNLTTSQAPSSNQIALAAITAAITALSAGTNKSVNFNGQQFEKKDLKDLIEQQTFFKAAVIREQDAQAALRGNCSDGRVALRFLPSSNTYPADWNGGHCPR